MIRFYKVAGCPYCAKVENKLEDLDIEYETHSVPRARNQREDVYELTGQYGVPVIADPEHGVEGMAESSDIVTYLERTYG